MKPLCSEQLNPAKLTMQPVPVQPEKQLNSSSVVSVGFGHHSASHSCISVGVGDNDPHSCVSMGVGDDDTVDDTVPPSLSVSVGDDR